MLCKVDLTFEPAEGVVNSTFSAVMIISTLYKVFLIFESVDGILKCDHSNESYRP